MATKKDLESRFKLSDNTVYKTLKACGLDTRKTDYSEAEIEEYFIPARKMLDENKTLQDVQQWAREKRAKESGARAPSGSPNASSPLGNEFADALKNEVFQLADETVQAAANEVIAQLPSMLWGALGELARNGSIREAFRKPREQVLGDLRRSFGEYYKEHNLQGLPGEDAGGSGQTYDVDATAVEDSGEDNGE